MDKLSDSLKKDVLTRKIKVKKSDIVALGELDTPAHPIGSPTEINMALVGSVEETEDVLEVNNQVNPSPKVSITENIETIIQLSQQLKGPLPSIKAIVLS
ncbi:hypothetical protein [Rudanella lutea]|uniref:hypothetical protein n=1 Tax=Rudanella lutea TaxID=451374 RepID=UPI00036D9969|nr:hypothetical protein [Rudanella lutea]